MTTTDDDQCPGRFSNTMRCEFKRGHETGHGVYRHNGVYRQALEARYEWRYVRNGTVTHALGRADDHAAACGIDWWDHGNWHGTGSQDEYERAAALPKCKTCLRAIGVKP